MSRPHRPKAGFWVRLAVVGIMPITQLIFRTRWKHLDRVPERGGVIIAINHNSLVDTVLMARLVWQSGRIPRFLIKSGLFHVPLLRHMFIGAGQIPVYRGTTEAAESLEAAVAALDRGEAIVIYPEGTITREPNQWPMQARTGIARLVVLAPDVPVVPIAQWGAQPRPGQPWWRKLARRTSYAAVGRPLDLSHHRGVEPTGEVLREITDEIMAAIRDELAELRGVPAPRDFFVSARKVVDKRRRAS